MMTLWSLKAQNLLTTIRRLTCFNDTSFSFSNLLSNFTKATSFQQLIQFAPRLYYRRIKTVASLLSRVSIVQALTVSFNKWKQGLEYLWKFTVNSRLNRKLLSGPALLLNLRCEGEARLLERTISQERWVMRVPLRNGISCKGGARSTHDNLVYLVIYIHVCIQWRARRGRKREK